MTINQKYVLTFDNRPAMEGLTLARAVEEALAECNVSLDSDDGNRWELKNPDGSTTYNRNCYTGHWSVKGQNWDDALENFYKEFGGYWPTLSNLPPCIYTEEEYAILMAEENN